jgi:hypothetical protein
LKKQNLHKGIDSFFERSKVQNWFYNLTVETGSGFGLIGSVTVWLIPFAITTQIDYFRAKPREGYRMES